MNPIQIQSTFYFKDIEEYRDAVIHEYEKPLYSRGTNPTVEELCKKLAPLEGKESAICFSSGMGAISALLFSYLKAGDHIICHQQIYSWAKKLITQRLPLLGIEVSVLKESELPQIELFIKPNTKLIYLENPTFFHFEIPLRSILSVTKSKNILTAMDNTFLGPNNLSRKITDQIDFIIHSTTKIISGHSDALGGAILTTEVHRRIIF